MGLSARWHKGGQLRRRVDHLFYDKQQTNTLPSLSLIIINKDTFENFKQVAKKTPSIVFKVIKSDNVSPTDNSTNANFVAGPPK